MPQRHVGGTDVCGGTLWLLYTPLALPKRTEPAYILNESLSGLQRQPKHFEVDESQFPLPGYKPWIIQPIA